MSDGPYGRHGFNANAGGYGGGASYGNAGGGGGGGGYAAPSYGQSYGAGASYSAPSPQDGVYGSQYGAYGGAGDYQVRKINANLSGQVFMSLVSKTETQILFFFTCPLLLPSTTTTIITGQRG